MCYPDPCYYKHFFEIKIDVNKVFFDADHEDEIPEEEKTKRLRYSIINASSGFIARVVHSAIQHKKFVGNACYKTAAFTNFISGDGDTQTVTLEMPDGREI